MLSNFLSAYEILFNGGRADGVSPPPHASVAASKGVDPALTKALDVAPE